MKNINLPVFLCLLFSIITVLMQPLIIQAQTVTLSNSNLPIVLVTTESTAINETTKVGASLKIVYRGDGQTSFITDQNNANYLEYNGRIGINMRGSSSVDFAKKQYSIEFWDELNQPNPQAVFDFGKEHDFILHAPYIDKSLMRNVLTYQMSNEMGQYAVKTKYCELILDGEYLGVYVFMERIKIDDDRLPLETLDPLSDNTYPDITGGYIWKVDKGTDGFATTQTDRYRFHDPKEEHLSTQQKNYLKTEIESFEAIMNSANSNNSLTGYASKIDVATWVDQFLLQEYTKNPDAFGSSMYYHKYRNGKLRMGPVWDLNLGLGASYHGLAHYTNGWTTTFGHALIGPDYNQDLFKDAIFQCLMHNRWFELRQTGNVLNENSIFAIIDSVANLLNQGAQQRNFTKWNNLGQQVWLEAPGYLQRDTYQKEVDYLKTWISQRLAWIDANMVQGNCPTAPPTGLVINEIMYNPKVTGSEQEGDYEFIELYNKGNASISLAGIQFSLGINYTFATGTLAPGQYLVLAGNTAKFTQRYGFAPFGEYAGGLSNSGEKIVLADTYGYILDEVNYNDELPWTLIANGLGASLELINPNLDNNLPQNWFANFNAQGSPKALNVQTGISCNPAPPKIVINEINYHSPITADAGDWVEIYNTTNASVSLSNWILQDQSSTYTISSGTTIPANGYLVLAQDLVKFANIHPNVNNVIGQLGFAFSNNGETITLSDHRTCLVDIVQYLDTSPWVITPDGSGPTLQLTNTNLDNNLASSWTASTTNAGTPGQSNTASNGNPASGNKIRFYLEGFLNTTTGLMKTSLQNNALLPNVQPYAQAPFYYFASTATNTFPANTVDWVLVEVRSASNPTTILERKALLLRNDGYLMNTNGSTQLIFNTSGTHYIAVYHKSHLGVMSESLVQINGGATLDFSTAVSKAKGIQQQKMLAGKATLFAGDFNGNGIVNNLDYNNWSMISAAVNQYLNWDADGNGLINNLDYNLWDLNKSKIGITEIQF